MAHNDVERVAAEQCRIGRLLAREDAARQAANVVTEVNRRVFANRGTAPTKPESKTSMTEVWIRQCVTHASLDALELEWQRKCAAIRWQHIILGRNRRCRNAHPLALKLGTLGIQKRLQENAATKRKIKRATHHIEWLRWVIDGWTFRQADWRYDLGDDYDQGILYEVLRRASGVRPLPWELADD